MKRYILPVILLASFLLFSANPVDATWNTYREDIEQSSGTCDIDITYWHNSTTTQTYRNISLPCQLGQLNRTVASFAIKANGTNISYNLTVDGTVIKSAQNVSDGNWSNTTLANIISGGVNQSLTYLNFTFDVNKSNNIIKIRVYGTDVNITSTWLSNNIVIKEKDVTTPTVGTSSSSSYWTVNDSITINNTIGYQLDDVNITVTYPSHAISEPTAYFNVGSIANNSEKTRYVNYQKRGPYVYDVDEDVSDTTHEVTIYVKSDELLTSVVDWTVIVTDDVYNGVFDTLNYDTLTVELNGVDMDWEQGSIVMEDFTVKEAYSQNKFVFTWTEAVPPTPPAPEPTPEWLYLIIIVAAIALIVIIYSIKK